jgi:cystathionine gamma-synthase
MMTISGRKAATVAVWGGEEQPLAFGAAQVPIVQSAPFCYPDIESWLEVAQGRQDGHIYSRNTNPTVAAFEEKMRL